MKKFTNQFNGSHAGRMNYGGAKFYRFALFPLMLFMLLLLPTRMVAQTEVEYDNTITFTALEGYPQGMSEAENFKKLFDGKKTEGNSSKWCCYFYGSAYIIFEASKAGVPVGYTITTGNDNEEYNCRNPLSWKLYGNNTGKDDAWTLIDEVSDDKVLKDENNTSYDFKCECSTSYKYFKWEISAIHSGGTMQVGEFELKLNTCSHKNADGSDALGEVINTVEPTCTEHGYTTHKCSLCNSIVKVYKDDELKPHTLTHHAQKAATCTEAGNIEYWQCSVCNKLFSDEATTKEITDAASLEIPAKGHTFDNKGTCTVCQYKDPRYDLFNNLDGITGVTITDNGSYPWQMLDLKAEGMENLGFTFPEGSNVLMSSNYLEKGSSSETVIRLNVSKPILLTSQVLVSSELNCDKATITLDNKESWNISGIKQKEIKALLSVGEHILKLSYYKDNSTNEGADRAFIYDLKTATTISDYVYVAESDATNSTLTFKKITSDNWGSLDLSRMTIVNNERTVKEMCTNNYSSIKNIIFDESFKTYAPTSLKDFFIDCTNLETISGLEYLNTANVTDMNHMFYGCSALKSLDLTHFNTAKVTDMSYMFFECTALTSLDLTHFNTANVTSMNSMLRRCSALESLVLTNFNTANVTDMNSMFDSSSALTSLDLTNFNTANVSDMGYMFMDCSALTTIFVSDKFVTTNVEYGYDMFKGCTNLKDYSDSMTDHTYANCGPDGYFTSGCWYAEFDNSTGTLTFKCGLSKPAGAYGLNEGRNLPDWNNLGTNVKKVVFDASFASARPTNCYGWFKDFTNLTTIEGFEYLNTENVTNMTGVFNGCSALTSLDLTNFNTAKVTDMKLLFANCSALESLDLSMFNTENVTSMPSMFNGATNLKTLNVSNFNTEKVNNMGHMFANCPYLTSLDLSSFNTKGVEYVDNIFKNCSNLTTIYASENFAFGSGLKNGADMFLGCDKLKGFIEYNKNTDTDKNNSKFANYKTGYFTNLVGKNGDEKIGAVGEILTAENLTLNDDKDFVAYEKFAAKDATYNRSMNAGTAWGTLCLPFAIDQSKETECKFYSLTGIDNDNDCITLESYEEGAKIPAGTPVLFKMNEGVQELEISAQNAELVKEPVAGTNTDVNLVGSFTKIGGKDNQGLTDTDYIIGKDKFWLVSELKKDGNSKGVGIKPMRAYIHPATASQARAAMLSIGKGDGTTAIDNLNAISNDANAEYYDANGRRTNGLQKGLNIVKRGSKTYKIMVK